MRFRPHELFPCILALAILLVGVCTNANAQVSAVTITVPTPSPTPFTAPSVSMTITANVTGTATKVVFYRNDVPYKTDTTSPYQITEAGLGEDTYSYRARAYSSETVWLDSTDGEVVINTKFVFKMGQLIPAFTFEGQNYASLQTKGPDRAQNHTEHVQRALRYLSSRGGGTLFFPCAPAESPDNGIGGWSIYNIKETIDVPPNVSLVGESAEAVIGRCRIYWFDPGMDVPSNPVCQQGPSYLRDRAMFSIAGGRSRIRFKDLWLYSRTSGRDCDPRGNPTDIPLIEGENTSAIEMAVATNGDHIRDVVIENVSIQSFTYGIKAVSLNDNKDIADIKIRGYRPSLNYKQLYIDAARAYNWDVQNLNISGMVTGQGGVHIVRSGKPSGYTEADGKLKFLQLNCNGNSLRDAAFCVKVAKHSGLYFKQLHHEGVQTAITVDNIGFAMNEEPIIFEGSGATGEFYDDSMILYLIGNGAIGAPLPPLSTDPDKGRLTFIEDGVNSTVVDCGDVYWDRTDVNGNPPDWGGWQMQFTHSERNRAAFIGEYDSQPFQKEHQPCLRDDEVLEDVDKVGGEFFNTGILPTQLDYDLDGPESGNEDFYPVYRWVFRNTDECPFPPAPCDITSELQAILNDDMHSDPVVFGERGSIYIEGRFHIDSTLVVPSGRQIVGGPGAELIYTAKSGPLLQIDARPGVNFRPRTANLVLRNLKLTTESELETTGIAIIGYTIINEEDEVVVGALSDVHFSGLRIEGFEKGVAADPGNQNPMLDGVSLKNIKIVNSSIGFEGYSDNASNWNVQNLTFESPREGAVGWVQYSGGNSIQGLTCRGTSEYPLVDCLSLSASHSFVNGLRPVEHVTNAVKIAQAPFMFDTTIYESRMFSTLVIRNSDLRSSDAYPANLSLQGRAFITSMNNFYENFDVAKEGAPGSNPGFEGDLTRVTHCGDTYVNNVPYPDLDDFHPNLWVGTPTPTRVTCGKDVYDWDDMVRMGGNYNADPELADKPMTGDFFDDIAQDYVLYRPGQATSQQSYWFIRRKGGVGATTTTAWGTHGDKPLVGNVFSGTLRSQLIVWRPSTGDWWVKDPYSLATGGWNFGSGVHDDVPIVGNFVDESGNKDEVGVYRPGSSPAIYYMNPRTSDPPVSWSWTDYGGDMHIADFLGKGYDQIAQFQAGTYYIIDPANGNTYSVALTDYETLDVPVVGKFVEGDCAQIGVWRPGAPGEFILQDTDLLSCDDREDIKLAWGTTHIGLTEDFPSDVPLSMRDENGLHRPTVYRPTKGRFPFSMADGQWWVHDVIPTPAP